MEREFDRLLAGAKGVVYLMFLGRSVNAFHVARRLLDAGIVKRLPTIYGCVSMLERNGLIRLVEVERGKRGPSKLRTADAEPLLATVRRRYGLFEERWPGEFQTLFGNLGGVLDRFPEYLSARSSRRVEDLLWQETLSAFIYFCKQVINESYWIKKGPRVGVYSSFKRDYDRGKIEPEQYRLLSKNSIVTAPHQYIKDSLDKGTFTQVNLTRLADLSGNPRYDVYESTFSGELFYMSIALKDQDLADTLKRHIENAVEYGRQKEVDRRASS